MPLEVEQRKIDVVKLRRRLRELPGSGKEHDMKELGKNYAEDLLYEPSASVQGVDLASVPDN